MLFSRVRSCHVERVTWLAPSILEVMFRPSRPFRYEPGQFISIVIPGPNGTQSRRLYSLASPYEQARVEGFRLCLRVAPEGKGSNFMASLGVGDRFDAFAPYGDFQLQPTQARKICFISTGTGIAPLRAMALSQRLHEKDFREVLLLQGARYENELIYQADFKAAGIHVIPAVSQPGPDWTGFRGRVTAYLESLPASCDWSDTVFYICGNGEMAADAQMLLTSRHGVHSSSIHAEAFTPSRRAPLSEAA